MKEEIVVVDDFHEENMKKLKDIDKVKESVQVITDAFVSAGMKMKELGNSLRHESINIHDPMANKRKKEQSFKNGVSNLKHIKKHGGR